jgi:phospholipase C
VALGEQLIHDVYEALRSGPGWPADAAGDHLRRARRLLRPRAAAVGRDAARQHAGEFGFGFDRFGVRVPTVLVSPLIAPGTVYRVPAGGTPLDHTSILKTVEQRWNLPTLTARDAAAPAFGDVLTLTTPRTDDVLRRRRADRARGSHLHAAGRRRHRRKRYVRRHLLGRGRSRHRASGTGPGHGRYPPPLSPLVP